MDLIATLASVWAAFVMPIVAHRPIRCVLTMDNAVVDSIVWLDTAVTLSVQTKDRTALVIRTVAQTLLIVSLAIAALLLTTILANLVSQLVTVQLQLGVSVMSAKKHLRLMQICHVL